MIQPEEEETHDISEDLNVNALMLYDEGDEEGCLCIEPVQG